MGPSSVQQANIIHFHTQLVQLSNMEALHSNICKCVNKRVHLHDYKILVPEYLFSSSLLAGRMEEVGVRVPVWCPPAPSSGPVWCSTWWWGLGPLYGAPLYGGGTSFVLNYMEGSDLCVMLTVRAPPVYCPTLWWKGTVWCPCMTLCGNLPFLPPFRQTPVKHYLLSSFR